MLGWNGGSILNFPSTWEVLKLCNWSRRSRRTERDRALRRFGLLRARYAAFTGSFGQAGMLLTSLPLIEVRLFCQFGSRLNAHDVRSRWAKFWMAHLLSHWLIFRASLSTSRGRIVLRQVAYRRQNDVQRTDTRAGSARWAHRHVCVLKCTLEKPG
jgi:hypothetical protein